MNTKKISLFLFATLIICFLSFEAMEKDMPKKIDPKQPLQMYEIIADKVAKEGTESYAKFESEEHIGQLLKQ